LELSLLQAEKPAALFLPGDTKPEECICDTCTIVTANNTSINKAAVIGLNHIFLLVVTQQR
jgi:hypothetical protein